MLPEGRSIPLTVQASNLVVVVKGQVQAKTGTPPGMQRLYFHSSQLVDYHQIAEYGIIEGSILELALGAKKPTIARIDR
jgi:hypothetical protein